MSSSLFDLSRKVVLVTGAAQGLGRAMSLALAEAGADVMLVDLNTTGGEATAADIRILGRRAIFVPCNVSEPEQIRALFAQLDRDFGRIDLRVAKILDAQFVAEADKLLCLTLDLGIEQRQVFAGIRNAYNPKDLVGRLTVMVANLAPRNAMCMS